MFEKVFRSSGQTVSLSFREHEKPVSNFRFPLEDFLFPQRLQTQKSPAPKS